MKNQKTNIKIGLFLCMCLLLGFSYLGSSFLRVGAETVQEETADTTQEESSNEIINDEDLTEAEANPQEQTEAEAEEEEPLQSEKDEENDNTVKSNEAEETPEGDLEAEGEAEAKAKAEAEAEAEGEKESATSESDEALLNDFNNALNGTENGVVDEADEELLEDFMSAVSEEPDTESDPDDLVQDFEKALAKENSPPDKSSEESDRALVEDFIVANEEDFKKDEPEVSGSEKTKRIEAIREKQQESTDEDLTYGLKQSEEKETDPQKLEFKETKHLSETSSVTVIENEEGKSSIILADNLKTEEETRVTEKKASSVAKALITEHYENIDFSLHEDVSLKHASTTEVDDKFIVRFDAYFDEVFIENAGITATVSNEGELLAFHNDLIEDFTALDRIAIQEDTAKELAREEFNWDDDTDEITSSELVIIQDEDQNPVYAYHLVIDAFDPYGRWQVYVHATTGEIIDQYNELSFVTLEGYHLERFPDQEGVNGNVLKFLKTVSDGDTEYTDADGFMDVLTFTASLESPHTKVYNADQLFFNEPRIASIELDLDEETESYRWEYDNESNSITLDELNTFYHINEFAEYFKDITGVTLEEPVSTYVRSALADAAAGGCTAWYDPRLHTIELGRGSEDCGMANFALSADVIRHEFAHAVLDTIHYYRPRGETGAIGEAIADYFSLASQSHISPENAVFGERAFSTPRDLNNELTLEDWVQGAYHDNSRILSGALWDIRKEVFEARDIDTLVANALYLHPETMEEFMYAMIIMDDDNNEIVDGTPNLELILNTFYERGIGPGYDAFDESLIPDLEPGEQEVPEDELEIQYALPTLNSWSPTWRYWDPSNMSISIQYYYSNGMDAIVYCWNDFSDCTPGSGDGWHYTYPCGGSSTCTANITGTSDGEYHLCAYGDGWGGFNSATTCHGDYEKDDDAPTVTITGAPASWQNYNATANHSCTDAYEARGYSLCSGSEYYLSYSYNPVTCPTSGYGFPAGSYTVTSHSWICGRQADNAGNWDESTPVEFKVDKIDPTAGNITSITGYTDYCNDYTNDSSVTVYWSSASDSGGSGLNSCYTKKDCDNPKFTYIIGSSCSSGNTGTTLCKGDNDFFGDVDDNAGNDDSSSITFLHYDGYAPINGSITYSDGYTTSTSVSISTNRGNDGLVQSGDGLGTWASSTVGGCPSDSYEIEYQYATLSNGSCGSYGGWSSATTSSNQISSHNHTATTGRCYKYRYIVHDAAGNSATYTSSNETKVDSTSPSCAVSSISESSNFAHVSGSDTVYYNSASTGSFTVYAGASDSQSGVERVNFPATVSGGANDYSSPYNNTYSWNTSDTYNNSTNITCYNNAGGTSTDNLYVYRDVTDPNTTPSDTSSAWRGSDVSTTLSCNDIGGSGCDTTYYDVVDGTSCSGASYSTYTGAISVTCAAGNACTKSLCYYSVDNVNNQETVDRQEYNIDKADPTCSVSSISESSLYAYATGTTVYYNTQTSGSFTVNASASDSHSGIDRVAFPATVSSGGSDYSSPYSYGYSWDNLDTYSSSANITCYDDANNTNTSSFTVTRDVTDPTGGSISHDQGHQQSTTINITANYGTDSQSGIDLTNTEVRYSVCPMDGNGSCTPSGGATATLGGTYPNYTFTGAHGYCYLFEYLVVDNVQNTTTYAMSKAEPACVDTWGVHSGQSVVVFDGIPANGATVAGTGSAWIYSDPDTRLTTVTQGSTSTISSSNLSNGTELGSYANQSFYLVSTSGDNVEGVPKTWYGTEFSFYINRGGGNAYVYAPFDTANVDYYQSSSSMTVPSSSPTITSGNYTTLSTTVGDINVIESDKPVVVYIENGSSDHYPLPPANLETFGIPSASAKVTAINNSTVIWTENYNGNWTYQGAVNRGAVLTISGTGGNYTGAGYRVIGSGPINVMSIADSDGSDATAWLPYSYHGTSYGLPNTAQHASFVAVDSSTTVTLKDTDGSTLNTYSMTGGTAGQMDRGPAYLYVDNTTYTLSAGRYFETSGPTWAVYDSANGDETNLWTLPWQEPFVQPGTFWVNAGNDFTPYLNVDAWDLASGLHTNAYQFRWRVNGGSWNYSGWQANDYWVPTLGSTDSTDYDFGVATRDWAGNGDSTYQSVDDVTIEDNAPTITINSPAAGSWQSANFTVDITNADTGGSGVFLCRYRIRDNSVVTQQWDFYDCGADITISVGSGLDCDDGAANDCEINLKVYDGAGNESSTVTRTFGIDTTDADVDPVTAGADSTNRNTLTSGTWYKASDVGGDGEISFAWTDPGSPTDDTFYWAYNTSSGNANPTSNGTTNPYVDLFNLLEGDYYFHVRAQEGNGNWGTERMFNIRYDETNPTCEPDSTVASTSYAYVLNDDELIHSSNGYAEFDIEIDFQDSHSDTYSLLFPDLGADAGGGISYGPMWYDSYEFNASNTADTSANAVCTDNAGNTASWSYSIDLDDTAPKGGTVTNSGGYQTTLSDISVSISGVSDSPAGLDFSTDSMQWQGCAMSGSGACTPTGSWDTGDIAQTYPNYTHSPTQGDCYTYRYVIRDNVYNLATFSGTNVRCVDTTAPVITSVTEDDANNIVTNGDTVTITGNVTDGESGMNECFAYWDDNETYGGTEYEFTDLGTDCDGTVTIPNSTNGTWYLCINPSNNADSTSYDCTNALTYDENAPTTTISDTASDWRAYDVTGVELDCSDNGSAGCADTYYKTLTGDVTCGAGGYSTYSSSFDVTCTEGTSCQYSVCFYSTDNAGNTESYQKQLYQIDKTPPTYDGYTINTCTYENGSTCWVKDNDSFIIDISHSDDTYFGMQYFMFNKDNCTPGSCPAGEEIQSRWWNRSGMSDVLTNDNYFDITSWQCVDGDSECVTDGDLVGRWSATAGSSEGSFRLNTTAYDAFLVRSVGPTNLSYDVNIDNTDPSTTIADTSSSWRNSNVSTTLSCGDSSGSGCDTTYYKVLTGDVACTAGGYSTYGSSVSVTCSVGSVCIRSVCFYSDDNVNNTESYNKQLYQIDREGPSIDTHTATESSNYIYYNSGSDTIYYGDDMGATGQSFTVSGTASESSGAGLDYASFSTFTGFSSPGNDATPATWSGVYSGITDADTNEGTITVTVYDGVANSATQNYTIDRDVTAPSGGSITYSNGYRTTDTDVAVTVSDGTDSESGLDTSTRGVYERSCSMGGSGSCSPSGGYSAAGSMSGSYPNYTKSGTEGECYEFNYQERDNVYNLATFSSANVICLDTVDPSGGSISYADGFQASTTVSLSVNDGTDASSGIDTTSRQVQSRSCTMSGSSCTPSGGYSNATTSGTYPSLSFTGTDGDCYQFQYYVEDRATNSATYTSSNVLCIESGVPDIVAVDAGASSGDRTSLTSNVYFNDAATGGDAILSFSWTDPNSLSDDTFYYELNTSSGNTIGGTESTTTNPYIDSISISEGVSYMHVKPQTGTNVWGAERIFIIKYDDSPPSCSVSSISESNNYAYPTGSDSVCYSSNGTGSYTVNVSASDTYSGVASVSFPLLTSSGTSDVSAPWAHTYNFDGGDSSNYSENVTCYDDVNNSSTDGVTVTRDVTAPTGGSVTYTNGYQNSSTSVSIGASDGTDSGCAGLDTTSRTVSEQTCSMTGSGSCTPSGGYAGSGSLSGSYPSYTKTATEGDCYQFRYTVRDNVYNAGNYDSVNVICIDTVDPAGGSISYTDGYQTATSVSLTVNDGTDSSSGIDTATRDVAARSCAMSGSSCTPSGGYSTVTTSGSYPNLSYAGTTGNCYQFQYTVEDRAGNDTTYTNNNVVCIDNAVPNIVAVDAGPSSGDRTSWTSGTWYVYADTGSDGEISFSWTDPNSSSGDTFYYELNASSGNTIGGTESTTTNPYIDNISISNGISYFHVRPRTGTGTWGTERTFEVRYDTSTPDIVAVDAGPSSGDRTSWTSGDWHVYSDSGSDDQISFSWTDPSSTSDDTFYYELNASSGNTVDATDSSTTNPYIDSISISEGTNYLHVRPRNGAGTWGTERTFEIKYDTTNPSCSVVSISETSDYAHVSSLNVFYNNTSTGSFIINASSSDATSGVDYVAFPATVSAGGNDSSSPYANTYNWDGADSSDYSSQTITCYDVAGNSATSGTSFDVTLDNTDPTVSAPTTPALANDDWTVSWSAATDSGSGLDSCVIQFDPPGGTSWTEWSGTDCTSADSDTFDPDTHGYGYGTYSFQMYAVDNVNNTNTSGSDSTLYDGAIPDIVAVDAGASAGDRTSWTSGTWYKYSDTGSDNQISFSWTDPSSTSDDTFYYELNASSGNTVDATDSSTTNPYIDSISISEGTNYFHVRPRTGSGSWGIERIFEIKYDTTNPSCSVDSISETSDFAHVSSLNVYYNNASTGSFIVNASSSDATSGVDYVAFPATVSSGGNDNSSPYTYTYNWDGSDTSDYSSQTITCYDVAGNSATSGSSFDVTLDNTVPSVVTPSAPAFANTDWTVSWGAASDSGSGLSSCEIQYDPPDNPDLGWLTWAGTDCTSADSDTFTPADGDGTYSFRMSAEDNVNNSDESSSDSTLYESSVPNIVAIDAGPSSGDRTSLTSGSWFKYSDTGSDDQISFSWTDPGSASDDTFYYELNALSGNSIDGTESSTTNPYIDSISITEGTNYFHVRPQNGATTWGVERIFEIKYDKTNPSACTIDSITESSDYAYATGTSVYYNSASTGNFTVAASGSDATSGIGSVTFPATVSSGGSESTPYDHQYDWDGADTSDYTSQTVTCVDAAGNSLTSTNNFNIYHDNTDPSSPDPSTPDYANNDWTVSWGAASDSGSGVAECVVEYDPPGVASWTEWVGTDCTSADSDTFSPSDGVGTYSFRTTTTDNVNNTHTSNTDDTLYDDSTPDIVAVDAGPSSGDRTSWISGNWYVYADTGSDDEISFSWTDPASSTDDTFYYELNTNSGTTIDGTESSTTDPYIDNVSISDGISYFHVRPRNGANTWGTERIFEVRYDTSTPDIIAVDAGPDSGDRTSLTSGTWFNYSDSGSDDQLSFSWTDPASTSDDTFYYELNALSGNSIDGTESSTTDPHIDSISISEGTNYLHVRPRNGANTWGTERTFEIKYDKTNPSACTVDSISESSLYAYVTSLDVYYNSSSTGNFTVATSGSDALSGINSVTFPATVSSGGSESTPYEHQYDWDGSDTSDYTSQTVTCVDAAGNSLTSTNNFSIYHDNTDPTVPTPSTPAMTNTDWTVSWDAASDADAGLSSCVVQYDPPGATSWTDWSGTDCTSADSDTFTPTDGSGTYAFRTYATDNVNNTNASGSDSTVYDVSIPDIVAVDAGPASGDRTSWTSGTWYKYSDTGSDDQISFSWTDPGSITDDTFYYELNGSSGDTIDGTESSTTDPYIDLISISEGTNYFHVRPRTGAGTWGTERTFEIKYDKTNPSACTIDSISESSNYAYQSGTEVWYNNDSTGNFTVNASGNDALSGLNSITFPATVSAGGSESTPFDHQYLWSAFNILDYTDQTVTCYDDAGNSLTSTNDFDIYLDEDDPVSPTPSSPSLSNVDWTVSWSGAGDPGSRDASGVSSCVVEYDPPGATSWTTWAGTDCTSADSATFSPSDGVGTYSFRTTTTDNVNNTNTSGTDDTLYDNIGPTIDTYTVNESSGWVHYDGSGTIYYGDGMGTNIQSFTVSGTSSDTGGSGLDYASFSAFTGFTSPGDDSSPASWSGLYGDITNTDTTNGTITVTIYDIAGNDATQDYTVTRDITHPSGGYINVATGYQTTTADIAISTDTGTDSGSGIGSFRAMYERNCSMTGSGDCNSISGSYSSGGFGGDYPSYTYTPTDGLCYSFRFRTADNVSNTTYYTEFTEICVDATDPNSSIDALSSTYASAPTSISGSSTDPDPGDGYSGVSSVDIYYKRNSDNYYWNGSSWVSGIQWLSASGTGTWSATTNLPTNDDMTNNVYYEIGSRATDYAGNIESSFDTETFQFVGSISISGTASINFGSTLMPGGSAVSQDATLTIDSTTSGGFSLTVERDTSRSTTISHSTESDTFPEKTEWNSSTNNSASWSGDGFGFRVKESGTYACGYSSSWWGTDVSPKYAGVPNNGASNNTIYSCGTAQNNTSRDVVVSYQAESPSDQTSGDYEGVVTYTVTTLP